jgi:hypothetical protein
MQYPRLISKGEKRGFHLRDKERQLVDIISAERPALRKGLYSRCPSPHKGVENYIAGRAE